MKKSISIVPFYEGQLQNRFFGEDAIGRDNVYEPYRILKNIISLPVTLFRFRRRISFFSSHEITRRCGRLSLCKKNVPMFLSSLLL